MEWRSLADNWVLQPQNPKAVVHFLGGAFVGAAPHVAYDALLTSLAEAGSLVITTPFFTNPQHGQIAEEVATTFRNTLVALAVEELPVFGMGHSLGCKLHLLNSCRECAAGVGVRTGNVLMAYSNASFGGDVSELVPVEFEPSPRETETLIERDYSLERTLLVKFERDEIDDIEVLRRQLEHKLGDSIEYRVLAGDHGTCAGGRYPLATSREFSPVDAIGQFLYQSLTRENQQLQAVVRRWLALQMQQYRS
ncbi:MAG: DUF1350 family protein [Cyanobacteria bacterium P01_E01_bin.34]